MDDSDDFLEDMEKHKKKKVAFGIQMQKDNQISYVSATNEEDGYLQEDQETHIISSSSQKRGKKMRKHN